MNKTISRLAFFSVLIVSVFGKVSAQSNCQCWVDRSGDTAFHIVPMPGGGQGVAPDWRNDDGYSNQVPIPFTFCFFGTSENSLYVNNNGNISFSAPYAQYSPNTFPLHNHDMVAPFWSDVETYLNSPLNTPGCAPYCNLFQSGLVWWKRTATYMIVQWDSVGYYSSDPSSPQCHTDKVNTFQCIISNGSDPIIPYGNNVQFCYKTMQWTTGDASSGVHGFGGHPATVGANKGDGSTFIQIGLFDRAGSTYLGQFPTTPYDGVSWLDNQSFFLNTCSASNLPPIAAGVSPCDTFVLCTNDTVDLNLSFLAIKRTDVINSNLLAPVPPGVSIISNIPGNTNNLVLQLIGSSANYGNHTVTVYGFDNETPPDTTFISFVLQVDSNATGVIVTSRDSICVGDSAVLKVEHSNATTYLWNNGATTDSIKIKPAITTGYYCLVSKGRCSDTIKFTEAVLSPPTLTITQDTICPTDSTTLTVLGIANSYLWNTGATTSSIRMPILHDTTFNVIAKNACVTDTLYKKVYLVPAPVITFIAANDSVCYGSNLTITANGGTAYEWSTGATTASITVSPTADSVFSVSVSNGFCARDSSFKVFVNHPLAVITSNPPSDSICVGDSVLLTAHGTCNNYLWQNNSSTADSIWVKPTINTTYTLQVTCHGCSTTFPQPVAAIPILPKTLISLKDTMCSNDSTLFIASGGSEYKWLSPVNSRKDSVYIKSNVTDSFYVVILTPCSADTLHKALHVIPAPTLGLTGITNLCTGQQTTLTASGGTTYTWNNGITTSSVNPVTFSPSLPTTYTLTVANGKCSADSVFKINVTAPPTITIRPINPTICKGDSVTLSATGGGLYKWINNSSLDSVIKVSPPGTTIYTVAVTNGCTDSATTTVTVDVPTLSVCCDATIGPGASTTLNATGVASYVWAPITGLSCFNCPSPIAAPPVTTVYTITGTDANGCTLVDTLRVAVAIPCADFQVPTVFTPNNDGINDDLVINVENPTSYNITIYDRWGKQVFTSSNATDYWNGKLNSTNNLAPDGTYYYVIKASCGSNEYTKKGFVELLGEK